MNHKKSLFGSFLVSLLFGSILLYVSYHGAIHTDEGWSFSEAYYSSKGLAFYTDFFSHRLPLNSYLLGHWFQAFDDDFFSARMFSVFFGTLAIMVLSYVIFRITKSVWASLISISIFWNTIVFYALSTATTYSLPSFLFSLSCLFLLIFKKAPILSAAVFLLLQGAIWMSRYPIDPHSILLFLFFVLTIWLYRTNAKHSIFLLIIAVLIPIWGMKSFFFDGDTRVFFDTVIFNKNQVPLFIKKGLIPEHLHSSFHRIFFVKKLELRTFYPILLLSLGSILFGVLHIKKWSQKWLNSPKASIGLYSLVFASGYYAFFFLSTWDFPITKVYILFPLSILIAFFLESFFSSFDKGKQIQIAVFLLFMTGIWPFLQDRNFLNHSKNVFSQLEQTILELERVIPKGVEVFALNPLFLQGNIAIDRNLSMEVFSFLHELGDDESKKHYLATPNLIKQKIEAKGYGALVLQEHRFFQDKHMGRILKPYRDELMDIINKNYDLKHKFYDDYRGETIVYLPKHTRCLVRECN
jgi:hypothetical protein